VGSSHYHALFGVAVVLLVIALIVNVCAMIIMERLREENVASAKSRRRILSPDMADRLKRSLSIGAAVVFAALLFMIWDPLTAVLILAALGAAYMVKERVSPNHSQKVAFGLIMLSIVSVLVILGIILFDIISHGLPALSWEFLTQSPRNLGREGGIFPAIVGTLYLVGGAILFALPIGVGAAIYLTEYTKEGTLTKFIRSGVDLLNGTPSIVFGLFGFAFLILFLNFGVSLLAGLITLGLMVLPTIIRTTEEALRSVPDALREGSFALGATKWQTIRRVVLPPAVPGILTGTILSIGRAAGETAPILFTAVVFSRRFLPDSLSDPVMALPYHLFILSTNVPGAEQNQYGTALVLLLLVIGVYLVAIIVRNHFQKTVKW
jgi:phosphate transport system permease protein